MGEQVDAYNYYQAETIERLTEYQSGMMSSEEAMDAGHIDHMGVEHGPIVWGVNDQFTLQNDLDKISLYSSREKPKRTKLKGWASGGRVYQPEEMTTAHLSNAIDYAERNSIESDVVERMKDELIKRTNRPVPKCECGEDQVYNEVADRYCGCCDACMPF